MCQSDIRWGEKVFDIVQPEQIQIDKKMSKYWVERQRRSILFDRLETTFLDGVHPKLNVSQGSSQKISIDVVQIVDVNLEMKQSVMEEFTVSSSLSRQDIFVQI